MTYFGNREEFKQSDLFKSFEHAPLGLIDIGSLDGVHPMVLRIAPIVHALCFELDPFECENIRKKYAKNSPFAAVTVIQKALDKDASSKTKLYISKHLPNTSLLPPSTSFVERYKAERFTVDRVVEIETQSLDHLIFESNAAENPYMGEFIKIDTQGSEYQIFEGARRVLTERCLAIWSEVEFFEVYEKQKTYAELDVFLKEHGFFIYGFYPHYRSTKTLDSKKYSGEERIMWADALFIKDPLDPRNAGLSFTERDLKALILIGVMCRYYDFSLELVRKVYAGNAQGKWIEEMIKAEARVDQKVLYQNVSDLYQACSKNKNETYLHVSHFVSRNRSNNSNDYLFPKTPEEG